ncbi:OmpA family protein [Marinovum sp.]|uniref:OmpA family protein n=1 Tax=Marinovum sp. TaxID=2024839 RepID=UPI002B275C71|nr:OmpA family protein [Marinovum sp.]
MRALAFLACGLAAPLAAQDLALPAGAALTYEQKSDPGSYALPTGPFVDGEVPVSVVEGAVLRQSYRVPGDIRTTLQLLAPLRTQIAASGYEILFDCRTRQCGGFDFRFGTEVLPGPGMYVDLTDFRFLAARDNAGSAVSLLVSRSGAAGFVQIIRVGDAAEGGLSAAPGPERPVLPQDSGAIAQQLETRGRVVLSDLSFQTGSATLGAGAFDSLAALARYLSDFPNRRIALVGHTDSVGALDNNIALSRQRAISVRDRLVRDHGVPSAQLEAGGMGYLAPLTSNLSAAGREANRRVEAVLVSTE